MRPSFTNDGLELLFYDTLDALQVCVHEKDVQGAIKRLENMHSIVRSMEPEPEYRPGNGLHIDGSAA